MAKAVAEAQGWRYRKHDEYWDVMLRVERLSGDDRVRYLKAVANQLHGYFYTRKRFLDAGDIDGQLDLMADFLDILEPLT